VVLIPYDGLVVPIPTVLTVKLDIIMVDVKTDPPPNIIMLLAKMVLPLRVLRLNVDILVDMVLIED
jgi:hypothetical protein